MRTRYNIGFSKRFQGIGFMLDFDTPVAMYRIPLSVSIKFLWFYAWLVVEGREL